MKAPKGQFNKFGGYKYRSCEDIVEAVKPILAKHNASLIVSDEILQVGDRFYIKATAKILTASGVIAEASAFAREPLSRKGMDEAQVTGASSSYARKNALNGLLAIDDTRDPDATHKHEQFEMTEDRIQELEKLIKETETDKEKFNATFKIFGLDELDEAGYIKAKMLLEKKRAKN
ncbi:MAG: ERF family protein [bacterium]